MSISTESNVIVNTAENCGLVNDELVYTNAAYRGMMYAKVLKLTRFPETAEERAFFDEANLVYVNGEIVKDVFSYLDQEFLPTGWFGFGLVTPIDWSQARC